MVVTAQQGQMELLVKAIQAAVVILTQRVQVVVVRLPVVKMQVQEKLEAQEQRLLFLAHL